MRRAARAAPRIRGGAGRTYRREVAGAPFRRVHHRRKPGTGAGCVDSVAHWITPPILPKRFDTHFYIVAAPSDQIAIHDGLESVDSVWINPERALAEADA